MNNLIASLSRKAINYTHKAQRNILKELREAGHVVPKLTSSKNCFDIYFLNSLQSTNEYLRLQLGVSVECLESQYTTAMWSSTDDSSEEGLPLDTPSLDYQLSATAKACLDYDLLIFISLLNDIGVSLATIEDLTGNDSSQVAHDFWLTRNGHGAGFWDGDYEQNGLGKKLTELADRFGECHLTAGAKGLVYFY
jgi:hypothetical protein